ncbi:3-oxoacyl-(acyl-carrier-protein) synthase 2 [uncultured Desulfobacterium sp.]|uniref:3-oxoacyl-(Acyl-carrier-protein) synthase 2 n=1 Tax=uncultured Desulfobacterium sp. TaxID=201089 RepID=A0A445MRR2_9BACT|nr:3-oxoacyl-(acyl-carrier-protein) synthase 2 [uncultured Desulfobacterium sp.]
MTTIHTRRVAITGIGIISSIGSSAPEFRKGLFEGKCGIGPISLFDTSGFSCRNAAQVNIQEFESFFNGALPKRASRCDILGLIAAGEAISDSGLDLDEGRENIAIVLGGGAGGMLSWEKYRRALWSGKSRPRPSLLLPVAQCSVTDFVANHFKFKGTRSTISTACSSSATSIGYGYDLISSGTHDIVVTGGSEALSELTFAGFNSLRQIDPLYCRPFDKNRRGLSLGEGAAILVLEEYGHARQRGADIYAEIKGYAINADAFHMTSPHPTAIGMIKVIKTAISRACVDPDEVDYINTHGTGTKINDVTETMAVKEVFGEGLAGRLSLSSTKSMVGHCLGASGAIEAVATVLAISEQKAPPTVHLDTADEKCDLNYTPNNARPRKIDVALSNSFAFGGNNTCIVFGKAGN